MQLNEIYSRYEQIRQTVNAVADDPAALQGQIDDLRSLYRFVAIHYAEFRAASTGLPVQHGIPDIVSIREGIEGLLDSYRAVH